MTMKHRARSSKITYKHSMISGLRKFLESIEDWLEIKSLIQAMIKRDKSSGRAFLTIQYRLTSGLKCLARATGVVQEVFISTGTPNKLEKR